MTARSLVLLASLVLAPSLLACVAGPSVRVASAEAPSLESSVPTRVFLETAGMPPTPPSSCDDVVAARAIDAVYEDLAQVRPACEGGCRATTCAALLVEVDVRVASWDAELASVRPELAAICEASVDGCLGVAGVALVGEGIDTIGLATDPSLDPSLEPALEQADPDELARLDAACQAGDAAACYAQVELDVLLYQTEWDHARYQASMVRLERACALEPRVYCRGLDRVIESTSSDCGG